MKDGLVLFYLEKGILYPVGLTKEQQQAWELLQKAIPGTIHVAKNLPQGQAANLLERSQEATHG